MLGGNIFLAIRVSIFLIDGIKDYNLCFPFFLCMYLCINVPEEKFIIWKKCVINDTKYNKKYYILYWKKTVGPINLYTIFFLNFLLLWWCQLIIIPQFHFLVEDNVELAAKIIVKVLLLLHKIKKYQAILHNDFVN